ncbi:hypothetical protein [Geminicoccus sp.]|uniref:hypothetical protein n=1 Tax=Geminicoccus sp. TaxID=2024832 RepID=UPI0039C8A1FB
MPFQAEIPPHADLLIGGPLADLISARGGDDRLNVGSGNDIIDGERRRVSFASVRRATMR